MSEKRTTPILGFRAWRFDEEYNLRGLVRDWAWPLGQAEAECRAELSFGGWREGDDTCHSPGEDCRCGFYGLNSLAAVNGDRWNNGSMSALITYGSTASTIDGADFVVGAILGWGRMVMHEHGWRAQYAKPVVLCHDDRTPMMVQKVADRYGLPLVHKSDLEKVAREFGEPYSPPAGWKPSGKVAGPDYVTGMYYMLGQSGLSVTQAIQAQAQAIQAQATFTLALRAPTVTNQHIELSPDGTMTTTVEYSDGRVEKKTEPTSSLISPRWGGFSW